MHGQLHNYFAEDHREIEQLLNNAAGSGIEIDVTYFNEFRARLLIHIGIEEKILLPAIKVWQKGKPHPTATTLRLQHGALAALLVPFPSDTTIRVIRGILDHHNQLEEGDMGFYGFFNKFNADDNYNLLLQVINYTEVPVMPYSHDPNVLEATRRAVTRAGYDFDNFTKYDR